MDMCIIKIFFCFFYKRSGFIMYFWYCEILNIVLFIEFLSGFNWKLVVLFLVVWIIVYLCMVKGIKLFGKVR